MIKIDKNKLNKLEKYNIIWTGYDYALLCKADDIYNIYKPAIRIYEKDNEMIAKVFSHSDIVLNIFRSLVEDKIILEITADEEIKV